MTVETSNNNTLAVMIRRRGEVEENAGSELLLGYVSFLCESRKGLGTYFASSLFVPADQLAMRVKGV